MSEHLAVLVHGLWGNPNHMWYVKQALHEKHDKMHILVSDTNVGNRTYDGVDVCGERIAKEVRDRLSALEAEGIHIKRISFVGYSLGGLGARYAIGVLHSAGFFEKVKPVSFTTFATPHCGVSPVSGGFFSWLASSIGPKTLSVTGAHIFLADGLATKKRPLLEIMSDPESPFCRGLQSFERLTSYANIVNDRSVPYFTAAMTDQDPFADLSTVVLHHDEEYGNTILDTDRPYTIADEKVKVQTPALTSREMILRGVMLAGLPLWLTIYSANAVVANYASSRRIALHRETNSSDGESSLSSMAQNVVEEVMDTEKSGDPAKLQLNPTQAKIVGNLNTLAWRKCLVHIQKTQHSHAAIVCRSKDTERLTEGYDVMRHWLAKSFIA